MWAWVILLFVEVITLSQVAASTGIGFLLWVSFTLIFFARYRSPYSATRMAWNTAAVFRSNARQLKASRMSSFARGNASATSCPIGTGSTNDFADSSDTQKNICSPISLTMSVRKLFRVHMSSEAFVGGIANCTSMMFRIDFALSRRPA